MIVDSMTHEEVYKELERDRENISRWLYHQMNAQRRRIIKCKRFPLNIWFDHTTPRKVRYLVNTVVYEKKMAFMIAVYALRNTKEGIAIYVSWTTGTNEIKPMVHLPHQIQRYAERAGVKKNGIELIKHFLERCPDGMDNANQDIVGKSVRYKGMNHLSCCIPEGVLLGQMEDNIYVSHTFITYDMCGEIQKESFEKSRSKIVTGKDYYKTAKPTYFDL